MPRNHGLGLDDDKGGSPASPQPGKPNPQEAVRSAQTNAMPVFEGLQRQELMARGKDVRLQSCLSAEGSRSREKQ